METYDPVDEPRRNNQLQTRAGKEASLFDATPKKEDELRDQFDCSPRQYHAGLDILWKAIEGHDLDGETAYHKCAARIDELEAEVERLREQLDSTQEDAAAAYGAARAADADAYAAAYRAAGAAATLKEEEES